MKHLRNSDHSLITWRGFLFFLLLAWLYLNKLKTMNPRTKINSINETGLKVFELLKSEGFNVDTAKFITAQAAHETGNFTSKIFKENNNLFGMKLPKVRKTTATGEKYSHAVYKNIEDSIKDFKMYFRARSFMQIYPSIPSYVAALVKRNYFEASPEEYTKGVEYFYNLYFLLNG